MKKIVPVIVLFCLAVGALHAKTPDDTLVMAFTFDDIISLDPAEIFEFSMAEFGANMYDKLVRYDVKDVSKISGSVAQNWSVSEDGKIFTFTIRQGIQFASGNPLTGEDVVFSLQRAVLLNKTPAFILNQFGLTQANAKDKIRLKAPYEVEIETNRPYAPTLVLYCLTSSVGSIVDKKLVLSHEKDGDLGYEWLKKNYAGSGPFKLRTWKPNEAFVIDRYDNYWNGAPKMKRVIARHFPEPTTQRLLLEKGDIDIARNLTSDQIKGLQSNSSIQIHYAPKGTIYYLGLNQKNKLLANNDVVLAMKYLIDYDGMVKSFLADQAIAHQTFLPIGFLGASDKNPFTLDVDKAKTLLEKAGLASGFTVSMDVRNISPFTEIAQSIQAAFAKANIKLEIIPGDGKQTLTKYRARNHDIYLGPWGADYQDPHTNADAFGNNPDNSDNGAVKSVAWRNAWSNPAVAQKVEAAMLEPDADKRAKLYQELQSELLTNSPFVIMFQQIEAAAIRKIVKGFVLGPGFDANFYKDVTKDEQ
jgi:peptide/nickel transport system substrate-binding protein